MKRWIVLLIIGASTAIGGPAEDFTNWAREAHGEAGQRAARFLLDNMPEKDRGSVPEELLRQNLALAFKARSEFPWAAKVPEEIFLNDVLPYAVFDETRESWRPEFLKLARPLVADARTASEAAQALNKEFFRRIGVKYHLDRKAPNQSPAESMASGMASCTGLSIILVNACRAVGIPARAVGTPLWTNGRGNHTWVEIWDDGWHFTGADEYDPQGLDRGWFIEEAGRARVDEPQHAIYATSWKRTGLAFPMPWSPGDESVAAVNITARYAKAQKTTDVTARLGVRLFSNKPGGQRIAAPVMLAAAIASHPAAGHTRAGTADLNDMPQFELPAGTDGSLLFLVANEARIARFGPLPAGDSTLDAAWPDLQPASPAISALAVWLAMPAEQRPPDHPALQTPLTREDATLARSLLGNDALARLAGARADEMKNRTITRGGLKMRWLEKSFGNTPPDGRSLWISLHGGGNAPGALNDQQWHNQAKLYQPEQGIYVAPRAPTDTWNLWHEAHIDPMLDDLIASFAAMRFVDPDKVYLMGYSAGGDGVWQLAPRMADRFAAAAMMAGHPNEATPDGLRNLPFAIFMGAEDSAYNRNKVARERSIQLAVLQQADPAGYTHLSRIYDGLGHWMDGKDAEALPWMAKFRRQPWPSKVVWKQDDVTHRRFYWLQLSENHPARAGEKIIARADGQNIHLDGDVPPGITLRLADELLDLDREVRVTVNGRAHPPAKLPRTAATILRSLTERPDPSSAATAILSLP